MSIQEAWEHEQTQLMPVPTAFDGYIESPARVSSTSLVSIARNRYSVPCTWAGHRVSVLLYPERVVIVADQQIGDPASVCGRPTVGGWSKKGTILSTVACLSHSAVFLWRCRFSNKKAG